MSNSLKSENLCLLSNFQGLGNLRKSTAVVRITEQEKPNAQGDSLIFFFLSNFSLYLI